MADENNQPDPVKQVTCPSCAAPLPIRGLGRTTSLGCAYCGAIIDIATTELKIIQEAKKLISKLKIPLGSRGTINGIKFEIIGFIGRTDRDSEYFWSEYLLFNPYHGFRWLSEYNNHWQFVTPLPYVPDIVETSIYIGKVYRKFSVGTSKINEVIGELYWEARRGDIVQTSDYISPPLGVSIETCEEEINVSEFEYIEHEKIQEAFEVKKGFFNFLGGLSEPIGISLTQPNPHLKGIFANLVFTSVLMVFAIFVQIHSVTNAMKRSVFNSTYNFQRSDNLKTPSNNSYSATEEGQSILIPSFEMIKKKTNLELKVHSNLENSWLFLNATLISEQGIEVAEKGVEVSYYHGYDSDGRWSEGSLTSKVLFSEVPPGRYVMRLEAERPVQPTYSANLKVPNYFSVAITQDVPYWGNFLIVFGILFIYFVYRIIRYASFESKRWAESSVYG